MTQPLDFLFSPPIAIMLVSMFISLVVSLANRILTNPKQLAEWRKEVNKWMTEFNKAKREGNKKLLAKLKRQQPRITQLQSKILVQSMKPLPVSMVIYLFFWWMVLTPKYSGIPVAFIPWFGEEPLTLGLFEWYVLCSFLFGIIFSRIFGTSMGVGE